MKPILISILIFLISVSAFSSDTVSTKYFPLKAGNTWVYNYTAWQPPLSGRYRVTISGTFVYGGKTYYSFLATGLPPNSHCFGPPIGTCRIDSSTGNLIAYAPGEGCTYSPNEKLLDSLASKFRDSSTANCVFRTGCGDTSNYTIFGITQPQKVFNYSYFEGGQSRRYVKNIGLTFSASGAVQAWCFYYLIGCVIDGVLYGDTSLVGIQQYSNPIPESFSLSQNYPNPFNPITAIRFDIPVVWNGRDRSVKLTIYDVTGNVVATLINQQLQPGSYSVDWDASNYPSGVYFYQLSIGNEQLASKKMVLIK